MLRIQQFDIWQIDFDPSVGQEIRKTRPALVMSSSPYNIASGTIFVVPLTSTVPKISRSPFYISIKKNKSNNLLHDSFANVSQLRAISKLRFLKKMGVFERNIQESILKRFLRIMDVDIVALRYLQ